MMDVYLLPVMPVPPGTEPPFELYFEPATDLAAEADAATAQNSSFFGRMALRFKQALAEGEEEERRQETGEADHGPANTGTKIGRFVKRKLAAAVAEQRLLWNLRNATTARLHHPTTITSERALELTMAEFKRDFNKHRLWCVIDTVAVVAQTPLAVLPGPNVLAYYLIFRSVGHLFSFRGASNGMKGVAWTVAPSAPLSELQMALSLEPAARADRVAGIADTLSLERLPRFMERVANRPRKP